MTRNGSIPLVGIKKASHNRDAESSDVFMNLDTNFIIASIKSEYMNYMESLEVAEEFKDKLVWNENKHLTIYLIALSKAELLFPGENRYRSLTFAIKSNEDNLKILKLPEDTKIPYLQQRDSENIFDYLAKHELINMSIEDKGGIFDITEKIFTPDFNNYEEIIQSYKQWAYHFLDVQLKLIRDDSPVDFNDYDNFNFFEGSTENEETTNLTNKVNDEIFSYQYKEASELFSMEYYLGAGCVFGVALERICMLIAQMNKLKLRDDKTEIGYFAHELYNKEIISSSYKKRLLGAAKFRNISSHTNAEAVKSDASVLDAIIKDLIHEYL